jgi:anti-sigma B factor antagonist
MHEPLVTRLECFDDGQVLRLVGELAADNVETLRVELGRTAQDCLLMLDVAGVCCLSMAAARAIAAAHIARVPTGGQIVVWRPHQRLMVVLRSSGLHRLLPIVQTGASDAAYRPTRIPFTNGIHVTQARS